MNFNVMPICLDALVEIFYIVCGLYFRCRRCPPPPSSFATLSPPRLPHTSTHQLNGGLWSAHSVYISSSAYTGPRLCIRQTSGRPDARAGSGERVSPHSSDVRLEPKMGQACSHTSFICLVHEQQRKEAHFLYREREARKAGGK